MTRSRATTAVLVCSWLAGLQPGHQPLAAAQQETIRSGAAGVVVDVVVRDRNGDPVTDLRKQDFELLEDGVRQEIGDVTMVAAPPEGSGESATQETRATTPPRPAEPGRDPARKGPSFLALVFDRLSTEARAAAYKGALAAVDTMRDGDFVAVYVSDLSLRTVQTYTNDREAVRKALYKVATRPMAIFDRIAIRDPAQSESAGDAHPSVPVVASAEFGGRPVETRERPAAAAWSPWAVVGLKTSGLWEIMARDQQGYATTNALLAVTAGLGTLPGRKSVIFFAEGLAIPEAVLPHFNNVVTTANRGNVSVYTIDAAGLRVHSKDAEIGREIRDMGEAGIEITSDGSNRSSLRMMERNEDVLRKDPRTSLTLLAQQTGGFLVENTNNLAAAFRQIDADRRFHYLLTYTPKNAELDGTWRSITVKVPDRRVTVRARSGYLAAPGSGSLPLLAHEGAALAALERSPAPADLPLRTSALVFPDGDRSQVIVLAATDAAALRWDRDDKEYRTDFAILARVRDSNGEVVRKASEPYRLTGPVQQVERASRGEILFFRRPSLDPGRYTLEVAVHDALAGRSGVRRTTVLVPDTEPHSLRVSSLVLVQRAERVAPEERQKDNPLYVGDVVVYPNLGEPVRKSEQQALTFFVVVVPGRGAAPRASVEIMRKGGDVLARLPAALPSADASGRIAYIAQLPIDTLTPGSYTVRLTVSQGERQETRESAVDLRQ